MPPVVCEQYPDSLPCPTPRSFGHNAENSDMLNSVHQSVPERIVLIVVRNSRRNAVSTSEFQQSGDGSLQQVKCLLCAGLSRR